MIKNLSITLLVAFVMVTVANAQKLNSGNWEVSIDKWAKSEKGMFGETQIVYEGVVEIYRGKTKMKSKTFQYVENTGKMVIKDLSKKIVEPQMTFSADEQTFTYNKPTGEEVKTKALKGDKPKNIVLSGVLIWLDYKP